MAATLNGTPIRAVDLLLFPWMLSPYASVYVQQLANPPTWSLCIEVASILFMPVITLCGRAGFLGFLAGLILALGLALFVHPACLNLAFFVAGAALPQVRDVPVAALQTRIPQFLGRISYSLYLSHGPVFIFIETWLGPRAPMASLPLAIAAGWLIWHIIERPSIAASRLSRPPVAHRDQPASASPTARLRCFPQT